MTNDLMGVLTVMNLVASVKESMTQLPEHKVIHNLDNI